MVNKRGWLRIVEAFIGAVLILSAIFIFANRGGEKTSSEEDYIKEVQQTVLEEIGNNDELRNLALKRNETELKKEISGFYPKTYEIEVRICNLTEKYCMLDRPYPQKEVYAGDRTISGNLSLYSPVKVRIFVWRKD